MTTQMGEICEPGVCEVATVCPARPATAVDQIEGVLVRCVAMPRNVTEVSALLRLAYCRNLTVLPRGAFSKSSWIHPTPVVDVLVDTRAWDMCRLDPATDLLTVGAGVAVASVQDELARSGRRLPIDPPSVRATIGGMLVTGETGPLGHKFGPPAVHVVDATVVLPDGTVTTVADRARMLGSGVCDLRWAQPGWPHAASVVVQATLRAFPQPPAQAWVVVPVRQPLEAAVLRDEILAAQLSPVAIELDLPGVRRSGQAPAARNNAGTMAVCFEGAPVSLTDRARQLVARLDRGASLTYEQPLWWGRYPFRSDDIALRLYVPDGELHPVCYALVDAVGAPVPVRGSIGQGHAWAAIPADLPEGQLATVFETVREVLLARGGSAVVQAAPARLRELVAPFRVP